MLSLNIGPIRLDDVNLSRELREHERQERGRLDHDPIDRKHDRDQHYPSYNSKYGHNFKCSEWMKMTVKWLKPDKKIT